METLAPKLALVLYQDPDGRDSELYSFMINGRGLLCNPGRADANILREFRDANELGSFEVFSGPVNQDILMINGSSMAFKINASERTINIDGNKKKILIPNTVFKYGYHKKSHHLTMYYTWSDDVVRDWDKNILYTALFLNTAGDGEICLGSSMTNIAFSQDPIVMREKIIYSHFNSEFNEWRGADVSAFLKDSIGKKLTAKNLKKLQAHFEKRPCLKPRNTL